MDGRNEDRSFKSPMNKAGERFRANGEFLGGYSPMHRSSSRLRVNRGRDCGSTSFKSQVRSNRRDESDSGGRLQASRGRPEGRRSLTYPYNPKRDDPDVKVHTTFSIGAVHRVFSSFRGEKESIIESIGFGGLMKILPQSRFPRLLVLWLVRHMDPMTGTIMLPNGETLTVSPRDVELVFGLPRNQKVIKCGLLVNQNDVKKIKNCLMLKQSEEITLAYLEKLLVKDYGSKMSTREKDAFKIAAVLYADAYFLAPKGNKAKVNHELFRYISDTAFIEGYDWCDYVLKVLVESTRRAKEALQQGESKVTLDGCLLFWVIYYIDNIDFGGDISTHCMLPRVRDFPYSKVKELVGDDKCKSDVAGVKTFGQNKLKPSKEVIYSRNTDINFRSDKRTQVLKCDRSATKGYLRNSPEQCNIIGIIENWSRDVNQATIIAREALLACMAPEFETKNSIKPMKEDGQTECTSPSKNAEVADGKMTEKDYIELVSDEDLEMSEENDGDNTTNLNPPQDTVGASVEGNDEEEIETYHCLMLKRLCGIGHLEQLDECGDNSKYTATPENETNAVALSIVVHTGQNGDETTIPQDNCAVIQDLEDIVVGRQEVATESREDIEDMDKIGMELATLALGGDVIEMAEPLCVVRSDQYSKTDNEIALLLGDQLVVDESYVDPNSKFGISPFTINLTHKDAPLKSLLKLERGLVTQTDEDKKRTWYRNKQQTEIEIKGETLEQMFTGEYDLTITAVNAVVRLFQEMDNEMYANWREKRWRHFLPVEFAVISLNCLENINMGQKEELATMFASSTMDYNVSECRLIFAPLMVGFKWSMYAWDFEKSRIMVLDPLAIHVEKGLLHAKHSRSVALMHRAMLECGAMFFPNQLTNCVEWQTEYIDITGGSCESYNSGIYSMFYARYFDGEFITRILTKGACRLQKINFLHQLLTMEGNEGDPPEWVLDLDPNNRELQLA